MISDLIYVNLCCYRNITQRRQWYVSLTCCLVFKKLPLESADATHTLRNLAKAGNRSIQVICKASWLANHIWQQEMGIQVLWHKVSYAGLTIGPKLSAPTGKATQYFPCLRSYLLNYLSLSSVILGDTSHKTALDFRLFFKPCRKLICSMEKLLICQNFKQLFSQKAFISIWFLVETGNSPSVMYVCFSAL